METTQTVAALRGLLARRRAEGASVGLVPTMGYLHAGHQELIRRAGEECDEVVTTIFVNSLQFAAGEDLDQYPRDPAGDEAKAAGAGSTVLFAPPPAEMYPNGADQVATSVSVAELAARMEGSSRPTHFAGVCTVVAKLFNLVGPCSAYFGEKDFQQLAIIRRMVEDLSFEVEVVGCPTVREADGLAMSSRNAYLTPEEREVAPVLRRALLHGAELIGEGQRSADHVRGEMAAVVEAAPLGTLDYVEVADPRSLLPVTNCDGPVRLFGAVQFGRARLIDNLGAEPPAHG